MKISTAEYRKLFERIQSQMIEGGTVLIGILNDLDLNRIMEAFVHSMFPGSKFIPINKKLNALEPVYLFQASSHPGSPHITVHQLLCAA